MRIAAALCLITAVVLAGCSSSRGSRAARQPRATTAYGSATAPSNGAVEILGAPEIPKHERVAEFVPPGAPALPNEDGTFVPAGRRATRAPYAVSDPCASSPSRPIKNLICPPRCGPGG